MSVEIQRLQVVLEANIQHFNKGLAEAQAQTAKNVAAIETKFAGLNAAVKTNMVAASVSAEQSSRRIAAGMSTVGASVLATNKDSARLVAGMSQLAVGTTAAGHAASGASTQMQALFHATRAATEGIAQGVPATQILAQQISHLSYAASGPGGLSGAFAEMTGLLGRGVTYIAGLITPAVAAGAALVGLGAAAFTSAVSWVNAQSRIALALTGIGSAAGVTAKDINRISFAASASGQVTVGEARSIALAIASTGKVSADVTEKATGLAKGLSLVLGGDTKQAAKDLAAALADPAKGVDDLGAKIGAYTDKDRQLVKTLATQNEMSKAQTIILNGVAKSTETAASKTTAWSQAWDGATAAVSRYYAQLGQTIGNATGTGDPKEMLLANQAKLDASLRSKDFMGNKSSQSEIDDLVAKGRDLAVAVAKIDNDAQSVKTNLESIEFGNIVRGIDPSLEKLNELQATLTRLKALAANTNVTNKADADTLEAAKRAIPIYQGQIDLQKDYIAAAKEKFGIASATLGASERQNAIDLQSIAARGPAQKADIAYQQTLKQLRDSGASEEEAQIQASAARAKSLTQSQHDLSEAFRDRLYATRQNIAQGELDNSLIGRSVEVSTRLTAQFQLLAAAKQEAFKNGTTVSVKEQLQALIDADEIARQAVTKARETISKDVDFSNSQFGRTDTERNVYSQMQGAGLLDNGRITAANELTAAKIRQNIELQKSIDLEKGFASTFVHDMAAGKSAVESLGDALNNLGSKLIDNGIDQLFAGLNKGAGSSGGGLLSSLFSGGAASLPKFANGGVSRGPAIFGEAGAEAAVPLPDGRRIPVDLRVPSAVKSSASQSVSVVVAPVFHVQNGSADGIEKLKGEIAKSLPSMVTKAMHQAFDRQARFARSGI